MTVLNVAISTIEDMEQRAGQASEDCPSPERQASGDRALAGSPVDLRKAKEETKMKQNKYPTGWNDRRVRRVLEHYDSQTEDEAIAEDEAAFELKDQTVMIVPKKLVPEITRLYRTPASPREERIKLSTMLV